MARVYRAYDHRLRQWRAIKLLLPEFARKSEVRLRFEAEAQALALLEHPNVVRIYDVRGEGQQSYIVMEICEGGSVDDWLLEHGPMLPRMAVHVGMAACEGLHAAHVAGIVHRDLKPGNLLIDRRGTVKITDFGIARTGALSITRTGLAMGTLGYMAPEQNASAKAVDERTDVYALGATLYTLVTGNSEPNLFTVDREPGRLKDVLEALRPVIRRAVAYAAADRYPSMPAMRLALAEVLNGLPEEVAGGPSLLWRAPARPEVPPEPLTMQALSHEEPVSTRQTVADTNPQLPPSISLSEDTEYTSFEVPHDAPDPWLTMTPATVERSERPNPSAGSAQTSDASEPVAARSRFDDLYVTHEAQEEDMRSSQFVETAGNWKLNAKRRELEEAHTAHEARPSSLRIGERLSGLAGALSGLLNGSGVAVLIPIVIAIGGLSVVGVVYSASTGSVEVERHRQQFWTEALAFRADVDEDLALPQDLSEAGGDAEALREAMFLYRRASSVEQKREAAESLAALMSAEYAVLDIQDKLSAEQRDDLGSRIRSIQQQRRAVDLAAEDWTAASQAWSGRLAATFGQAVLAPE
jgi:serine/threonine protein kinase